MTRTYNYLPAPTIIMIIVIIIIITSLFLLLLEAAREMECHPGNTAAWLTLEGRFLNRQWHRNQDANRVAVDQVYIVRNPRDCSNKAGETADSFSSLGSTPWANPPLSRYSFPGT